jgi:hypothetical protein
LVVYLSVEHAVLRFDVDFIKDRMNEYVGPTMLDTLGQCWQTALA